MAVVAAPPGARAARASRLGWLAGLVLLGAVVVVALRYSEGKALLQLARRAEPSWLVVAAALQAATYLAQGEVWRGVTRAAGSPVGVAAAFRLSLAKLFVDQALPSGGISGTVLVAASLTALGIPRRVVLASVVVDVATHYAVYVLGMVVALLALAHEPSSGLVLLLAAVFSAFALVVTASLLWLSGRSRLPGAGMLARIRPLRLVLELLEDADPRLVRKPRVLIQASACQLAIVSLDVATMWVLLRALGTDAPPAGVFASFMISSLLRTMSVLPGGLGTFEAASLLTLKMAGIAIPTALAATLVFRGLSFWLPMLPGLWFSRRALGRPLAVWSRSACS